MATTTPAHDEIPDRAIGRESRRSKLLWLPYTALLESVPIAAASRARYVVRAVGRCSDVDMNVDAARIAATVVVAVASLAGVVVIGSAGRGVTGGVTVVVTGGIAGGVGAAVMAAAMAATVPVAVPMAVAVPVPIAMAVPIAVAVAVAVPRSAERVPAVTAAGIAGTAVLVAVVVAGIVGVLVSATAVMRRRGDAVRYYGGRRGAGAERHTAYDYSADNCRSGEQ